MLGYFIFCPNAGFSLWCHLTGLLLNDIFFLPRFWVVVSVTKLLDRFFIFYFIYLQLYTLKNVGLKCKSIYNFMLFLDLLLFCLSLFK